jgi:hypothetical protein
MSTPSDMSVEGEARLLLITKAMVGLLRNTQSELYSIIISRLLSDLLAALFQLALSPTIPQVINFTHGLFVKYKYDELFK